MENRFPTNKEKDRKNVSMKSKCWSLRGRQTDKTDEQIDGGRQRYLLNFADMLQMLMMFWCHLWPPRRRQWRFVWKVVCHWPATCWVSRGLRLLTTGELSAEMFLVRSCTQFLYILTDVWTSHFICWSKFLNVMKSHENICKCSKLPDAWTRGKRNLSEICRSWRVVVLVASPCFAPCFAPSSPL